MRMTMMLLLAMGLISLSACSSVSGNVVPEKGPAMEQVYDSMETANVARKSTEPTAKTQQALPSVVREKTFHKLPNPELKMYVFPHLAGNDEVPVPGYYTQFSVYNQDHYVSALNYA